ncbi:MAG: phosphomannomutase/phosphoglucomutase [Planctomycetota bacterium]
MAGIFKSYDIRGTVPDQLNTGLAYRIGRAAGKEMSRPGGTIAVGHDMRESAGPITAALLDGLHAVGVNTLSIGQCSTPMTYFACGTKKTDGAIMVTASHNPAEYNGFKCTAKGALPMSYDTGISAVEALVGKDLPAANAKKRGKDWTIDMLPAWMRHVRAFGPKKMRKLKIAVDTGNGVMGPFVGALVKQLPITVVPLFFKPDGRFPNHEANPLKAENVADLQKAVLKHKCDFGVAFDGDGDRLAFVDDLGAILPCDVMTALLAKYFLATNPGGTVLYDLRSTKAVAEVVKELGGQSEVCRVGHSHIKMAMRKLGKKVVFAGELSGHYYYRDNFFSDSGEITFMAALHVAAEGKLSELRKQAERYFHSGEINFHVADAAGTMARVEKTFAKEAVKRFELDGLSMEFKDWWFNLRSSNTEPVVRLNMESLVSQAHLEAKKAEVLQAIGVKG